ncbi:hypothetical protein MVEN_00626800 [Mycena venus]|uniref:Uncharacterized protein n=1 Tax=Mycena venus TaxID=2733690 RepID=A0A8H7D8L0_9AGAR|nr:hypothetical protein MVEN_00626800 [Mycena venus]
MLQPAPQPVNPWPQAPTQRPSRKYPAPCIKKYTAARSTSSVWGESTARQSDDDSDDETVAAFTTTSIASSQSRAPGNKPKQQRRVKSWVNDTNHYTSEFKSPFVPATAMIIGAERGNRLRYGFLDPRCRSPSGTQPLNLLFTSSPPVQYAPRQPPIQYAQPQVVWMPAQPPPQPGAMRGNGHVQFVPPPRTVAVPHVQGMRGHGKRSQ